MFTCLCHLISRTILSAVQHFGQLDLFQMCFRMKSYLHMNSIYYSLRVRAYLQLHTFLFKAELWNIRLIRQQPYEIQVNVSEMPNKQTDHA